MARHASRAPDLEMQVRTEAEHGKTRLSFVLHSPAGTVSFSHRGIKGPLLQTSPGAYQEHLLGKIEKLGARLDIGGSPLLRHEIASKLESLGRDLWRELFPPELQAAYREEIRSQVRSWVIVSDEPWIPWEIVKPYDGSRPGDPLDDDFLCFQFELTRWLADVRPYVQEIRVGSVSVVQSAPDLPHAAQERALFDQLKKSFPQVSISLPRLDSAFDARDFLTATEADLIHFIGHGVPMKAHPDESGLPFADKSILRPADLHGPLATHLGNRRPMIFLNTCWAGKEGWSLTRLGGWASRWVDVCGCGAFIAPLWPVRDQVALSFAWAFYDELAHGATLGAAALAARRKIHQERQGDPSVLAYTVYGHPHAQLHFDDDSSEKDGSPGEDRKVSSGTWTPKRLRKTPRWLWALGACLAVLAVILHFAAAPLTERWLPEEPLGPQRSLPKPKKVPAPPPIATTTVGGLSFEISGGRSSLHSLLKAALHKAAQPLVDAGISGWTLSLKLDPPRIAPNDFQQVTCRLTAQSSVQGRFARFDLGPVEQINSQTTEKDACEAAITPLVDDVLNQFAAFLRKRGES
jgi:hypothetical protein